MPLYVVRLIDHRSVELCRAVAGKPRDAIVNFDRPTYRNFRRRRVVLPAIARISCLVRFHFVLFYWQELVKLKLNDIAVHDKSSQSYEASLAIWDHTVLPCT